MSTQRFEITDDTPIAMLTVGQLKEVLFSGKKGGVERFQESVLYEADDYIRGLNGICNFFGVTKGTAIKWKEGVLKTAVLQEGHTILVDKQKAIELLKAYKEE